MRFYPALLKWGFPCIINTLIFSTHSIFPSTDLLPTAKTTSPSPVRYGLQWPAPIPLFAASICFFSFFLFIFSTWENAVALTSGRFTRCFKTEQQQKNPSVFQLRKPRKTDVGRKTHVQWDWSLVIDIADENNKSVQASRTWARALITGSCCLSTGLRTFRCSSLGLQSSLFPPHFRDILGKTWISRLRVSYVLVQKNETTGLLRCWRSRGFALRNLSIRPLLF